MEIRKTAAGLRYREMIYIEGQAIKSPFFVRKSDAKKWKAQKLTEREKIKLHGKKSLRISESKKTLNEYAQEWIEKRVRVKNTVRTEINYSCCLNNHVLPVLGEMKLVDVETLHLDELRSQIKKKGNNNKGINIIMGVFKSLMNDAFSQKLISQNPFVGFQNLPKEPLEYSFWTKGDMAKFLASARNSELYELYLTALYTGMRRGELAGLCWDRLDFQSNVIAVTRTRDKLGLRETTKSKSIRYIPIHPMLKEGFMRLLKEQRNRQYVFAYFDGRPVGVHHLYRTFRRDQVDAGIENSIKFHDMRHTFASQFMMNGGNIYDLQKILGHSDLKMTERYAHHSPEHLQTSIKHFGFGIEQNEIYA